MKEQLELLAWRQRNLTRGVAVVTFSLSILVTSIGVLFFAAIGTRDFFVGLISAAILGISLRLAFTTRYVQLASFMLISGLGVLTEIAIFLDGGLTPLQIAFPVIGFLVYQMAGWRTALVFMGAHIVIQLYLGGTWNAPYWTTFVIVSSVILTAMIYWNERVQSGYIQQIQLARAAAETARQAAETAQHAADYANQAKSEFLANMSHELRTPLNAIMGYAQILERDPGLTAAQHDGVRVMLTSSNHLLRLINDILDLAKIEAGKLELHPTDIAPGEFLSEIGDIMRARAEQKQVLFVLESGTLPLGLRVDATRLRQVLLNLLSNAVKFTTQGRVILRVTQLGYSPAANGEFPETTLRFEVVDTGIGMDEKQMARLFRPFEQVGNAVEFLNQGTGLGLSVSQRLVQAMGGNIQVRSAPLAGSRFWFELRLPIVPVTPTEPALLTVVGYTGPRRKILVVDDRGHNRLVLVDMLRQLDFEIMEAEDGAAAIQIATTTPPDLILMDLVMPVLTGIEATQRLRQLPETAGTPIVAVSASTFTEDHRRAQVAGCDAFLPKPIKLFDLLRLLEQLLGLTWTYATPEPLPVAAPPSGAPLTYPPPALLAEIRALAEAGDVGALQPLVEELAAAYPEFARRLKRLVQEFNDAEIIRLSQGRD